MLVNLIPQESSKCKTSNARKLVFVKEYKPDKNKKYFTQIRNKEIYCLVCKKYTDNVCKM